MAQHDYIISNGTGAAVRSDINGGLAAIVSNNSGSTEPATMYAYQWWPDTTTGLLKQRNSANNAWITIGTLASTNLGLATVASPTFTGVVTVPLGTAALPSLAVLSDPNTGIFSPGADQLAISTNGVERVEFGNTEVVFNDGGANYDFRVEGDTVDSLFFVDASTDKIGIGSVTALGPKLNIYESGTGMINALHLGSGGGTAGNGASISFGLGNSQDPTANLLAKIGGIYTGGGYQGALTFHTNANSDGTSPQERLRIDSSGRLLVGPPTANANGGILQLTSGITFPATAVAATDANTLDDYEEGTFIATLRGSTTDPTTPVTSTARYTKIGNVVYIQVNFDGVNTTGAAGSITISGLPITPATGHRYIGSVFSSNMATFTGTMVSTIDNNLTIIYFYAIASNAANGSVTHNAGTSRTLHVTCFYYV